MKKVLGIGNALVDIILQPQNDDLLHQFNFPKGSMQLIDQEKSQKILQASNHLEKAQAAGGSAANTINGISNLGGEAGFIGTIGQDEIGSFFKKDLEANHIEPHLSYSKNDSGRAYAIVTPDSERTFGTFLGAALEMNADSIDPDVLREYDYVHVEGYLVQDHELITEALRKAKQAGLFISIDLASFNVVEDNLELLKGLVRDYVDIVFANEEEAKAFTGKEPEEALQIISEMTEIAVVKIGKEGSLVKEKKGSIIHIKPYPAERRDTSGAGDLYAAGFLYGLTQNFPLEKCGAYGNVLSAKVIEHIGPKMTVTTWNEIKNILAEY